MLFYEIYDISQNFATKPDWLGPELEKRTNICSMVARIEPQQIAFRIFSA
jgi:hypothetical protein